jgi:hypothetical protein
MTRILHQQGFNFDPVEDNKSVYNPDELFTCLEKYGSSVEYKVDERCFTLAKNETMRIFGRNQHDYLSPLSYQELKPFIHLMNASGAPEYRKKGEAWEAGIKLANRIVREGAFPHPCTAYHRVQHHEGGPRDRLVWGFPLAMTILEGRFARPLIVTFLSRKTPMCFGLTKLGIASRLRSIMNHEYQYGLDYSKFDASVSERLIHMAFDIIKTWFSHEYAHQLYLIEDYFINTPIVMPDGNIYVKHRGVPSGSYFTQLVDSIVNFFSLHYMYLRLYGRLMDSRNLLVLGDDSVFGCKHHIELRRASQVLKELGLTMNPEKVSSNLDGEAIHFLGHTWADSLPHRQASEVAKRMVFPERWRDFGGLSQVEYAVKRSYAFLTDCVEAGLIIRRMPFNKRLPNLHQVALRASSKVHATDWQLLLDMLGFELPDTPGYAYYMGVFS